MGVGAWAAPSAGAEPKPPPQSTISYDGCPGGPAAARRARSPGGSAIERTKIVATLGPASSSPEVLRRLLEAGVDVVRLNLSHGAREQHLAHVALVRAVAREVGRNVAVLADLQGPKIRVGELEGEGVTLPSGATCELVAGVEKADPPAIPVTYEHLAADVRPGDRVLLDDGAIELRVRSVRGDRVTCEVVRGGVLRSRKGLNLPGVAVSAASLSDKDRADLAAMVDAGVDYLALSFVRTPDDVLMAKAEVARRGAETPVVAKLERPEAIADLDGILAVADAVMVARGDLGVEMAVEKVPVIQKHVIASANSFGVPVITATQMLESMITSPRPTRAEASDVANAIFDGTDAVMLSGETAVGAYPVEAVRTMCRIAREAEASEHLSYPPPPQGGSLDVPATICKAAVQAAADLRARVIVAFTESGATARMVSRFRPRAYIVGLTPYEATRRRMALYRSVEVPEAVDRGISLDAMLAQGDQRLVEGGFARPGDLVVVVAGTPGDRGATNRVIVRRVGQPEGR